MGCCPAKYCSSWDLADIQPLKEPRLTHLRTIRSSPRINYSIDASSKEILDQNRNGVISKTGSNYIGIPYDSKQTGSLNIPASYKRLEELLSTTRVNFWDQDSVSWEIGNKWKTLSVLPNWYLANGSNLTTLQLRTRRWFRNSPSEFYTLSQACQRNSVESCRRNSSETQKCPKSLRLITGDANNVDRSAREDKPSDKPVSQGKPNPIIVLQEPNTHVNLPLLSDSFKSASETHLDTDMDPIFAVLQNTRHKVKRSDSRSYARSLRKTGRLNQGILSIKAEVHGQKGKSFQAADECNVIESSKHKTVFHTYASGMFKHLQPNGIANSRSQTDQSSQTNNRCNNNVDERYSAYKPYPQQESKYGDSSNNKLLAKVIQSNSTNNKKEELKLPCYLEPSPNEKERRASGSSQISGDSGISNGDDNNMTSRVARVTEKLKAKESTRQDSSSHPNTSVCRNSCAKQSYYETIYPEKTYLLKEFDSAKDKRISQTDQAIENSSYVTSENLKEAERQKKCNCCGHSVGEQRTLSRESSCSSIGALLNFSCDSEQFHVNLGSKEEFQSARKCFDHVPKCCHDNGEKVQEMDAKSLEADSTVLNNGQSDILRFNKLSLNTDDVNEMPSKEEKAVLKSPKIESDDTHPDRPKGWYGVEATTPTTTPLPNHRISVYENEAIRKEIEARKVIESESSSSNEGNGNTSPDYSRKDVVAKQSKHEAEVSVKQFALGGIGKVNTLVKQQREMITDELKFKLMQRQSSQTNDAATSKQVDISRENIPDHKPYTTKAEQRSFNVDYETESDRLEEAEQDDTEVIPTTVIEELFDIEDNPRDFINEPLDGEKTIADDGHVVDTLSASSENTPFCAPPPVPPPPPPPSPPLSRPPSGTSISIKSVSPSSTVRSDKWYQLPEHTKKAAPFVTTEAIKSVTLRKATLKNNDNGMNQVPNLDLINELKLKSGVPISQLKEDQIKRNKAMHSTENIDPIDLSDFTMEKFLDKVPEVTKDGHSIPPWKRQMMARKEAERAKNAEEERRKQEAEERRIAKIPPWRLQMLGIKPPEDRQRSSPSHTTTVTEPGVKKRSYSFDEVEVNGQANTRRSHLYKENLEEEATLATTKKNSIPRSLLGDFMVQSLAKKEMAKSVSDEEGEDTVSTLSETLSEKQEHDVAITPAKKPPGRLPRSPLATLLVESLGQRHGDPEESTVDIKKLANTHVANENQLQNVPKSMGQKPAQVGDATTDVTKTTNNEIPADSNSHNSSYFYEDLLSRRADDDDDDDDDDEYNLNTPPIIIEEKVENKIPDTGSSTKTNAVLEKPGVPKQKADADDKQEVASTKKITDVISSFKSLEAKQQSQVKALYPIQTQYSVRPKQAQVLDMHGNPIGSWKDALSNMKR